MNAAFTSVISSNIEGYFYLSQSSTLLIAFKKGGTYAYDKVPPATVAQFELAASKGTFFQLSIRNVYSTSKLDDLAVANLVGSAQPATPRAQRKKSQISLDSLLLRYPQFNVIF